MILRLRAVCRLVVGPVAVAAFAGVELAQLGGVVAALGAYVAFVLALFGVSWWGRLHFRRADRHLILQRTRRSQRPRRR